MAETAMPRLSDSPAGRGEVTVQELTRLQQTVSRRMAESKATAPDFAIALEVDMEEAVAQLAEAVDVPAPSYNDLVIKAAALALREFPRANGAYRDGRFELYSRVNVGVAVAGQDALVFPTVFDADRKSLATIAAETRTLAARARSGEITPPELSAGTFTVSNLGMYGIRRFTPVINPPQAAILAVGELSQRPAVREGAVVARHLMELTLACDHRILFGADAAAFLGRIRALLEAPSRLLV
jgi:pyruvate dehydrogenase E2 component (dihydrolipoamide acetyltransferase)